LGKGVTGSESIADGRLPVMHNQWISCLAVVPIGPTRCGAVRLGGAENTVGAEC
jgi:hypothetical protein